MTVQEAISARHSVRTYLTKPVEPAIVNALRAEIRACNAEGGLHIQLVMNEPMAFRGFFAHYGKFRGVCNYIVLAGKRAKDLDERAGWFGERLVLLAQTLGLNTCWVGLTFSKAVARRSYVLAPDERLVCVIAFGYGAEQGEAHESRPMREVYRADGDESAALPLHAPAGRYRSGGEPGRQLQPCGPRHRQIPFSARRGPRELPLGGVSRRFRTRVC